MVYGYALKDDWLYSYAMHKGAVLRGNTKWDKENVIFAGISTLMCDAGVYGESKLRTVSVKGEQRSFIALATNDPRDGLMKVPPPETWAKLKELLHTETEPKWRRYV